MNKICGIYKITNPNSKIYIGQSVNIKERFRGYKFCTKRKIKNKLMHSFQKYSYQNHIFEVIEECSVDLLNERERYWQEYYKSVENGLNCVYTNTSTKSGYSSEETKLKLSKSKLGKKQTISHREAISKGKKGKLLSKEIINNMKVAQKKWRTERIEKTGKLESNNKRKLLDISTGIIYKSILEASILLNIEYSKLYYHARKSIKYKII